MNSGVKEEKFFLGSLQLLKGKGKGSFCRAFTVYLFLDLISCPVFFLGSAIVCLPLFLMPAYLYDSYWHRKS